MNSRSRTSIYARGRQRLSPAVLALIALLLIPLSTFLASRTAHADANLCQLNVPPNPLSASGLAMTWTLQLPCHESNSSQAVFVQAVIFDKDAKTLSTYAPLVVDAGTSPAIAPVAPVLPKNADIAIFGGGDDDATTLTGPGATSCVNGADGQVFGQVFFCNARQFFADVNAAHLSIPSIGVGKDGQPCPTVRSFKIVDQDQSDNVQSTYLVTSSGQTAQNTAANRAALGSPTVMKNGSDNRLLSAFVGPALGCSTWKVPDLADNGILMSTQATNELQAAAYESNPQALIPAGDPMVGPNSLAMVNAYRLGVDQPQVHALGQANTVPYCQHIKNAAPQFIERYEDAFKASSSPTGGVSLYDFLVGRLAATQSILGCK